MATIVNNEINGGLLQLEGAFGRPPNSKDGVTNPRAYFLPAKAAFRSGQVSGTQWDVANVGNYSTAFGQNVTASGQYSFSVGQNCSVSSNYGMAVGVNATVTSDASIAFGGTGSTVSGGYGAVLGGNGNTLAGNFSAVLAGGLSNNAGDFSAIIAGIGNSIGAGATACMAVGSGIVTTGTVSYCTGMGANITMLHDNSVVLNASTSGISTFKSGTVILNSDKGVGLNTNNPNSSVTMSGTVSSGTVVVTANFTTTNTKFRNILVNTSVGAITATLDSSDCVDGREYIIKDIANNAFTNNITITPNGGKTINGLASLTIAVNGGSVIIIAGNSQWYTVGG